jgi:hypothetical protein
MPGSGLPITLDELKRACNAQNTTDDDDFLTDLTYSVVDMIERETGKVLRSEQWMETFEFFPGTFLQYSGAYAPGGVFLSPLFPPRFDNPIMKPGPYWDFWKIKFDRSPVSAVNSVQYYDAPTNTLQTMSGSDYYFLSPTFLPAFIAPKTQWPATYVRPDAVQITYTVGWSTLPAIVKDAVRSIVATKYRYRESESEKRTYELNLGITRILERIRNV